jgi:hypothetical protein
MAARLFAPVARRCLAAGLSIAGLLSFLPAWGESSEGQLAGLTTRLVEWREVDSLRSIEPEPGDLVILDVDETLIDPVHPSMHLSRDDLRRFWAPVLGPLYGSRMSLAWCADGRRLVEETAPVVIDSWKKRGVEVMALTSRQRHLPWGTPMAKALAKQLQQLGLCFSASDEVIGCGVGPGRLCCTGGVSKVQLSMLAARADSGRSLRTVWVVDDRPDRDWGCLQLKSDDPHVCVVRFQRAAQPLGLSPLLDLMEMGFYLKTGRWPAIRCAGAARGLGPVVSFSPSKRTGPRTTLISG